MSSHVDTPDEEPLSNLVLTDGDETTLATAPDHDDADHAEDHDLVAESAAIDAAIDAVADSGIAADPVATDGEVDEALVRNRARETHLTTA